jgi:hypothetical protein
MAGEEYPGPLHDERTRRSGYQYFFYDKHHNPHNRNDAQWLPELSHEEEFEIFNLADVHEISGTNGDLFGLRRSPQGKVLPLGTEKQQVAKFPWTHEGRAWHGYPLWPIKRGDEDRTRLPAPQDALRRMEEIGWLDSNQRRRIGGGKHI